MGSDSLEEVDLVPLLQGDDRLLPVGAAADEATDPLLLAADDLRLHVVDLDVEQRLDRLLDLDLVGVAIDLEEHLRADVLLGDGAGETAAGLAQAGALLGEERALDHVMRGPHSAPPDWGMRRDSSALAVAIVTTSVS